MGRVPQELVDGDSPVAVLFLLVLVHRGQFPSFQWKYWDEMDKAKTKSSIEKNNHVKEIKLFSIDCSMIRSALGM